MEEKFLIHNIKNNVSIIDTEEDNVILFNVACDNEEDGKYIEYELQPVVRLLNEQNKILKNL